MLARSSAVVLTLLAAACGPDAGGEPVLVDVLTTGAGVGDTGRIRVVLREPAAHDADVLLEVAEPRLARVPEAAHVEEGTSFTEVGFEGLATGMTTVRARLGARELTAGLVVVLELGLVPDLGTLRLQVGETTALRVPLNAPAPRHADVAVESSDPSVVAVEPLVTIPEFGSVGWVELTALSAGTARLTATWGESRGVAELVVSPASAAASGP